MIVEEALYAYLTGTGVPALTALIAKRIYPLLLPEAPDLPALTYQRIGALHDATMDGPSGLVTGARFQLCIYANTFLATAQAFEQLRLALLNFKTIGGMDSQVQGIFLLDDHDAYEEMPRRYRKIADFEVWYAEATS